MSLEERLMPGRPGMGSGTNRGMDWERWCVTANDCLQSPKLRFTPEERLKDMDEQGVDVQVVSIHTPLFGYDLDSPRDDNWPARSTMKSPP